LETGLATLININIYEEEALAMLREKFDLIILKDVIEHIPNQEKFIPYIKQFLKPGGRIFFGFPPWYMPHGGHQQICKSKFLGFLPYFHILPKFLYKGILKVFGESNSTIIELLEIKDTGISIERFERIVKNSGYQIEQKQPYLINPIYLDKFGWKPRKQFAIINHIPLIRNFLTTCVYYVIRK
jgi:2-polyprenyl-3-methyl-5-hydroxy-6-metoxy-1,4-benzoquinol methylase